MDDTANSLEHHGQVLSQVLNPESQSPILETSFGDFDVVESYGDVQNTNPSSVPPGNPCLISDLLVFPPKHPVQVLNSTESSKNPDKFEMIAK